MILQTEKMIFTDQKIAEFFGVSQTSIYGGIIYINWPKISKGDEEVRRFTGHGESKEGNMPLIMHHVFSRNADEERRKTGNLERMVNQKASCGHEAQ